MFWVIWDALIHSEAFSLIPRLFSKVLLCFKMLLNIQKYLEPFSSVLKSSTGFPNSLSCSLMLEDFSGILMCSHVSQRYLEVWDILWRFFVVLRQSEAFSLVLSCYERLLNIQKCHLTLWSDLKHCCRFWKVHVRFSSVLWHSGVFSRILKLYHDVWIILKDSQWHTQGDAQGARAPPSEKKSIAIQYSLLVQFIDLRSWTRKRVHGYSDYSSSIIQ